MKKRYVIVAIAAFAAWFVFFRRKAATVSPTALSPSPAGKGSATSGGGGNPITNLLSGSGNNPLAGITASLSRIFGGSSGGGGGGGNGAGAKLSVAFNPANWFRSNPQSDPTNYPELQDLSALPPGEAASYKDAGVTYFNTGLDFGNLFGADPFVNNGYDPGSELSPAPSPVSSPTYVEPTPAPVQAYDPASELSYFGNDYGAELGN